MELNGESLNSTNDAGSDEHISDFSVIGYGSDEFRRNSESESMEEVSLRIRQLLMENKELRENAQKNSAAMTKHLEVLKKWKEQELEKRERIKTQYAQAGDIIAAVREENIKLKHKLEQQMRTSKHTEVGTNGTADEKMEFDMLYEQLEKVKVENEDMKKKMITWSQSTTSLKKMTTSSMEVNVVSHGTIETQTEVPTPESNKELEVARMQANQLMQDLESLQKLKDDIEQQKGKIEQERDELMDKIIDKENITMKLLREKREVVAMNNQLNMEVDRLMKENDNLWDAEKEKTESLKNYDTVQDFSREIDQQLDVQPIPSPDAEKEVNVKGAERNEELGTISGNITIRSGDLREKSQTIQQILLQLQEQQEENQKLSKEISTKSQQITQLQSDLDAEKTAIKDKERELDEVKIRCGKEVGVIVLQNVEKDKLVALSVKEEKLKLHDEIAALNSEVSQKVSAQEELRKHLDNTTELLQKQIISLTEVNDRRKAEVADQTQLLATMNNSHRQQIEEMRREILHLSDTAADKQQKTSSESQQTELLQQQVNTLMIDLRTESTKLETKTRMCNDYKVEADRLNLELQKLQTKDNEMIEAMRLQIGSLQSKLHVKEVEVEKKRHDLDDLSKSQNQLLTDYQELFTTHDKVVNKTSDNENQLRLRVAQLQRESITRQEECKALKDEVRIKQEEIEDLLRRIRHAEADKEDSSLFQIMAETYKEDFGREREARERAHEDVAALQAKFDDLLLSKQQLDDELRRYSQQQIAQMQQRNDYVIIPQQQGQQPHQIRQYPYPAGANPERLDAFGFQQPHLTPQPEAPGSRPSPSRQPQRDKHICPKCQVEFDDLDTLQIHVFDCLDRP